MTAIDLARIRRNIPITTVLPAANRDGRCPFCGEPRLTVDAEGGFFDCGACNEWGDIITAFALIEGVPYREAARRLHEKAVSLEHLAERSKRLKEH